MKETALTRASPAVDLVERATLGWGKEINITPPPLLSPEQSTVVNWDRRRSKYINIYFIMYVFFP